MLRPWLSQKQNYQFHCRYLKENMKPYHKRHGRSTSIEYVKKTACYCVQTCCCVKGCYWLHANIIMLVSIQGHTSLLLILISLSCSRTASCFRPAHTIKTTVPCFCHPRRCSSEALSALFVHQAFDMPATSKSKLKSIDDSAGVNPFLLEAGYF